MATVVLVLAVKTVAADSTVIAEENEQELLVRTVRGTKDRGKFVTTIYHKHLMMYTKLQICDEK